MIYKYLIIKVFYVIQPLRRQRLIGHFTIAAQWHMLGRETFGEHRFGDPDQLPNLACRVVCRADRTMLHRRLLFSGLESTLRRAHDPA